MEKKQTSVQWLLSKHPELGTLGHDIIEQSLALEREQIEDAYANGTNDQYFDSVLKASDYYTQTYSEPLKDKI